MRVDYYARCSRERSAFSRCFVAYASMRYNRREVKHATFLVTDVYLMSATARVISHPVAVELLEVMH